MSASTEVRYPEIEVQLTGREVRSKDVLGAVMDALSKRGVSQEEIEEFRSDALKVDDKCMRTRNYGPLIQLCMRWVTVH